MKVHVGADVDAGVVHTVSVAPCYASGRGQLSNLLRKDDRIVIGDASYVNGSDQRAARKEGGAWPWP